MYQSRKSNATLTSLWTSAQNYFFPPPTFYDLGMASYRVDYKLVVKYLNYFKNTNQLAEALGKSDALSEALFDPVDFVLVILFLKAKVINPGHFGMTGSSDTFTYYHTPVLQENLSAIRILLWFESDKKEERFDAPGVLKSNGKLSLEVGKTKFSQIFIGPEVRRMLNDFRGARALMNRVQTRPEYAVLERALKERSYDVDAGSHTQYLFDTALAYLNIYNICVNHQALEITELKAQDAKTAGALEKRRAEIEGFIKYEPINSSKMKELLREFPSLNKTRYAVANFFAETALEYLHKAYICVQLISHYYDRQKFYPGSDAAEIAAAEMLDRKAKLLIETIQSIPDFSPPLMTADAKEDIVSEKMALLTAHGGSGAASPMPVINDDFEVPDMSYLKLKNTLTLIDFSAMLPPPKVTAASQAFASASLTSTLAAKKDSGDELPSSSPYFGGIRGSMTSTASNPRKSPDAECPAGTP